MQNILTEPQQTAWGQSLGLAAGPSSFSLAIENFIKRAKIDAGKAFRKICLDITRDIIIAWPVDTGRSRANWIGSFRGPVAALSGFTPGTPMRDGGDFYGNMLKATNFAIDKNVKVVLGANLPEGKDWTYYLTNNVYYSYLLEYGWSQQAPSGVVRRVLAKYKFNFEPGGPITGQSLGGSSVVSKNYTAKSMSSLRAQYGLKNYRTTP